MNLGYLNLESRDASASYIKRNFCCFEKQQKISIQGKIHIWKIEIHQGVREGILDFKLHLYLKFYNHDILFVCLKTLGIFVKVLNLRKEGYFVYHEGIQSIYRPFSYHLRFLKIYIHNNLFYRVSISFLVFIRIRWIGTGSHPYGKPMSSIELYPAFYEYKNVQC